MEDDDGAPTVSPATRRWRRRYGALLLVPAVGLIVWAERRPIATRFIDRELTAARVPARYTIADLGLGRQRLTDVVIGDPADPDLTADWVETRTAFGVTGPHLSGLAAGNVRIRAKLVDGRVSLGAIDRLLPAPSGKPFALPSLPITVGRAIIDLATPYGPVRLGVAGQGRLDDGFTGPVAAIAPRLRIAGCTVHGVRGAMRVSIDDARPHLTGPIGAQVLDCPSVRIAKPGAQLDLTLTAALDGWRGSAKVATAAIAAPAARAARLAGTVDFEGKAAANHGAIDAVAAGIRTAAGSAARVKLAGTYTIGDNPRFEGEVHARGAALAERWRTGLTGSVGEGTPVAPLVRQLTAALDRASRNAALDATLRLAPDAVAIADLSLAAASGAQLTLSGGEGIAITADGVRFGGRLTMAGGDLPRATAILSQAAPGAAIRGTATIAPYVAGDARLALAPVTFAVTPGGAATVATRAKLTGPLGDGRVEGLELPLVFRTDGRGRVTVNPDCTPMAFQRLAIAGLVLDPARLRLCPTGPALVAVDGGTVTGGARLTAVALDGRLGTTPLALTASGATIRLSDRGFALDTVAARIGPPARQTLIAADRLTGTLTGAAVAGSFTGVHGQIANVPLLMSGGDGAWQMADGILSLTGALTVADAQASAPRFRPLAARQVALTLRDGRIAVTGVLHEPTTGTRVADVAIDHLLATGRGHADLSVPKLTFGSAFQPDLLTPLTFGVVADVKGAIDGRARIDWSPERVTSTGDFGTVAGTSGIDLAAAFGPAQGIVGRVRFDDLLGLHTAPGQVATIRSVNPGIEVIDGTLRYQLLGGTRVQVEGAEWPFAGGTLTLAPSLLDFDQQRERRLTFRVAGARADQFLQQFDFDNLNATGVFDGTLPMIFDQSGGRIENGRLAMREGGGTIAYVGALGKEQLGVWGNLAFQALRSLRYRSLALTMNGPLAGEMVTDVRFAGVSQGQGAKSNFIVRRLQRLPFVFNVRIRAPFRGLIDSAASFYDPRRLIQRNLPALLEEQNRRAIPAGTAPAKPSIQPPASETVR
ncbi:YdbH domain-containing protein [Sphingomonas sp. KR1UV-12]|uniref:YdbH domain-containing protein n=1 Tax=Sphingomonas aurea TaxID=3063994 RepID=A0ABT9EGA9_9SPHN|nr:YdbH domain-containing protein [Sphingomonas sp. KR1UV-12]MDP1025658.1 YdbH domain-containing protein [Sphingomonas sp. KR1UV-12]